MTFRRAFKKPKQLLVSHESVQTDHGLIDYELKRSSSRRTFTISIDQKARVLFSAPLNAEQKDIDHFLNEKAKWIVGHVDTAKKNQQHIRQKTYEDGSKFLFLGEFYTIRMIEDNLKRIRIEFDGAQWQVYVPQSIGPDDRAARVRAALIKWYRQQAEEILGGRIFNYSRIMGVAPKKIAVRSHKRVWGNCDYRTQTIHLNWQIILSPIRVVDYVVVHELCHLMVPNHSRRFWKKVEAVMPDYNKCRKWLKDNFIEMTLP